MVPEQLEPRLELLREEYVLVQAWKKTASYIRYHNWFFDTLALDLTTANLPAFIGQIRERLHVLVGVGRTMPCASFRRKRASAGECGKACGGPLREPLGIGFDRSPMSAYPTKCWRRR